MPRPSTAAVRVGSIYAAFGIAWIVFSDWISAKLADVPGDAFPVLQTFNGIGFVLVSALLVGVLVGAGPDAHAARPRSGRAPLVIFLLLSGAIAATGASTYFLLRQTLRDDTQRNLGAVAELKAAQIAEWLGNYQMNAQAVIQGPHFVRLLRDSLPAGRGAWERALPELRQRLDFVRANYGFASILLLDTAGNVLLASGPADPPADGAAIAATSQAPGLHLRDFTLEHEPNGGERVALALFGRVALAAPSPEVIVYLRIDPELFLFPLVQSWPTPSETAETLLIRREGDEVVYLNELRHRQGTALKLRRPVSDTRLPAARLAEGQKGVFEGVDYRGVPVLAYLKPIPGTPWLMISKIDTREAYAALDRSAIAAAGLGGGFLMLAGLALRFWWRYEQQAQMAKQYQADLERQTLAQHFDYLSKYANDVILLADADRRILEANDRCLAVYGYSRAELLRMRIDDLREPGENTRLVPLWQRLFKDQALIYETRHRRRDGSGFPVECSVRVIERNGRVFFQDIIRDITERHLAEQRIRRLNQLYLLLFHSNEAMVRARSGEELFRDVCRLIVDEAGFKQACMALNEPESGAIQPKFCHGVTDSHLGDNLAAPMGPAGHCLRLDRAYVCNDIATDPGAHGWRDGAGQAGVAAVACFPLRVGGETGGVLCIYAGQAHAFDHEVVALLGELVVDLGFALDRFGLERQRRAVVAELRASEARYAAILDNMTEALVIGDPEGHILTLNPAALRLHGFANEDEARRPITEYPRIFEVTDLVGRTLPTEAWPLARAIRGEVFTDEEIRIRRRDTGLEFIGSYGGAPVRDPAGHTQLGICTIRDITAQKRAEERIAQLAFYDALTGLPNRTLLYERLNAALGLAERHRHCLAVCVLDLDRFKHINDSLGHPVGDLLLQEMARRMKACVREEDTVARPGGDEFMLVLPETTADGAAHAAEKIVKKIAEPMLYEGHELKVGCSIGISLFPDNGRSRETLIQHADAAMYRAKQRGRNGYQFFTEEMHRDAVRALTLEQHLRRALDRDELILYYQPQVHPDTGRLLGAEALVRWRHPEWGVLPSSEFIPLAEECGLIHPIGRWVLYSVAAQVRAWERAGLPAGSVAVNLSANQFRAQSRHRPLRDLVAEALQSSGMAPESLELEITESSLVEDTHRAVATLNALHDLGVRLAIDGFGTGYSSLSHLRRFPVGRLKIDQSFIHDLGAGSGGDIMVDAILGLAANLGFGVVAEGVETETQWRKVRDKGCQVAQGFYFSPPLPPAELETWLAQCVHPWPPMAGAGGQV